jgi:hypothetical protein
MTDENCNEFFGEKLIRKKASDASNVLLRRTKNSFSRLCRVSTAKNFFNPTRTQIKHQTNPNKSTGRYFFDGTVTLSWLSRGQKKNPV